MTLPVQGVDPSQDRHSPDDGRSRSTPDPRVALPPGQRLGYQFPPGANEIAPPARFPGRRTAGDEDAIEIPRDDVAGRGQRAADRCCSPLSPGYQWERVRPRAILPEASVPMKLPAIVLPPSVPSRKPLPDEPLTIRPRTVLPRGRWDRQPVHPHPRPNRPAQLDQQHGIVARWPACWRWPPAACSRRWSPGP